MPDWPNYRIVLRESLDHFSPIGVDWYHGLMALGHSVSLVSDTRTLYSYNPEGVDVFINMMSMSDGDVAYFVDRLRNHNPSCRIISTVSGELDRLKPYLGKVDLWFDCGYSHPQLQEWFGQFGQNFTSILEAANERLFFKGSADAEHIRDFSFIGQFGIRGHGYREEDKFLFPLVEDANLTHYLFGFTHGPQRHIEHINYADVNTIFNYSRINLNFHYPEQKGAKLVLNKRTFDIAASGNFQLIDHPLYEQIVGLKAYPNPKDYIDAFYYYLNRPDEREKVAQAAQKCVLEKHTWTVRMKKLLHDVYNL